MDGMVLVADEQGALAGAVRCVSGSSGATEDARKGCS